MEAELTEMDSIPDHLAVSEDECVDEAVPIHIQKIKKDESIQRDNEPRYQQH